MARLAVLLALALYSTEAAPVLDWAEKEIALLEPKMQGGIVRPGNKDLATRKVCFAAYKACSAKADEVADAAEEAAAPSMELLDAGVNKGAIVRPNNKNQSVRKVCYSAFKACMSKAAEEASEKTSEGKKTDEEVASPALELLLDAEMELIASKPGRPDHNRNPDLHKGDNKDKQPGKGTIIRPADKQRAKAEKAAAAAGADEPEEVPEEGSEERLDYSHISLLEATNDKPKPGKPHKNPNMEKGDNDAKAPNRGSITRPTEKKRRKMEAAAVGSDDGTPTRDEDDSGPTAEQQAQPTEWSVMYMLDAKPGKPHPNPDHMKGSNQGKVPKQGTIVRPADKKEHKAKMNAKSGSDSSEMEEVATEEAPEEVPAEEGEAAAEEPTDSE